MGSRWASNACCSAWYPVYYGNEIPQAANRVFRYMSYRVHAADHVVGAELFLARHIDREISGNGADEHHFASGTTSLHEHVSKSLYG